MLNSSVIKGTNIVTATYSGSLGAEQMEELRDQLSRVVAQHGNVRLLVEIGDLELGRMEPRAIWEDLKLVGRFDELDRYAVVADHDWVSRLVNIADAVTPFDLRVFPIDQRDHAVAWLSNEFNGA